MSKMNRRRFFDFLPKGLGGFLLGKGLFQPEETEEPLVLEIEEPEDPEVSETHVEPMTYGASAMTVLSPFPPIVSSQWAGDDDSPWEYDDWTKTYRRLE